MGVNSLPKFVTRQRRDCDLNPGPTAYESSTLITRLPSHLVDCYCVILHSVRQSARDPQRVRHGSSKWVKGDLRISLFVKTKKAPVTAVETERI